MIRQVPPSWIQSICPELRLLVVCQGKIDGKLSGRYPCKASAVAGLTRISPMKKQHIVSLTEEQRANLKTLLSGGQAAARTLTRARILLKADTGPEAGGCSDGEIGQALEVSRPTIERV